MATRLYYEEAGQGTPVVFVHEYAGDYRTWEPQMRHFCAFASLHHLQPARLSAVRRAERRRKIYGQDISRDDVVARDGRAQDRQSAYRRPFDGRLDRAACRHPLSGALHFGRRRRLRLGLESRSESCRGDARARRAETGKMFAARGDGGRCRARLCRRRRCARRRRTRIRAAMPNSRSMLSEHSAVGHALTMLKPAAQAPDAVGHGRGVEEFRRRCW